MIRNKIVSFLGKLIELDFLLYKINYEEQKESLVFSHTLKVEINKDLKSVERVATEGGRTW